MCPQAASATLNQKAEGGGELMGRRLCEAEPGEAQHASSELPQLRQGEACRSSGGDTHGRSLGQALANP